MIISKFANTIRIRADLAHERPVLMRNDNGQQENIF